MTDKILDLEALAACGEMEGLEPPRIEHFSGGVRIHFSEREQRVIEKWGHIDLTPGPTNKLIRDLSFRGN